MNWATSEKELEELDEELLVRRIGVHATAAGLLKLDTLALPVGGHWELMRDDDGDNMLCAGEGVARQAAWQLCHEIHALNGGRIEGLELYPFSEPPRAAQSAMLDTQTKAAIPLLSKMGALGFGASKPSAPVDLRWHRAVLRAEELGEELADALGDVLVGHLDTGFSDHPQLDGAYVEQREEISRARFGENGWCMPSHGTHTASVLASNVQQAVDDVIGIAPRVKLYPVRVHKRVVLAPWNMGALADAIDRAVDAGCQVLSISMGGPIGCWRLRAAVDRAVNKGVMIVAAAGQLGERMDGSWLPGGVTVPGSYENVITAAACAAVLDESSGALCRDKDGSYMLTVARWSARGPEVDVSAPGWPIAIASWEGDADRLGGGREGTCVKASWGTSYATAQTAGVVALWIARHRAFLARYADGRRTKLFKRVLEDCRLSTRVAGWSRDWGHGVLAVDAILEHDLEQYRGLLDAKKAPVAFTSPQEFTDDELGGLLDRLWTRVVVTSGPIPAVEVARQRLVEALRQVSMWRDNLTPAMQGEVIDLVYRDADLMERLVGVIASGNVALVDLIPRRSVGPALMSLELGGGEAPLVKSKASSALLAELNKP
jgi:hypothetical protein